MEFEESVLKPEEKLTLALRRLYETCGYKKYVMSQFEEYGLYLDNKNFLASERVITFTDLDGRLMALKPDVTLSIVKHAPAGLAQKVYYLESVYRPGKAGRNFCEISQMGLEHIGVIDSYAICEAVYLAGQSLAAVSPNSLLELGHMGFALGLLEQLGIAGKAQEKALRLLCEKNTHELAALAAACGLDSKDAQKLCLLPTLCGDAKKVLQEAEAIAQGEAMQAAVKELKDLTQALLHRGAGCRMMIDFSLLAEADYYNGVVFSGYIDGLPDRVLAGGQYDQVVRRFGSKMGAVGFALYLSELLLLLSRQTKYDCDTLVRYTADADLAELCAYIRRETAAGRQMMALSAAEKTPLNFRRQVIFDEKGAREVPVC